VNNKNPRKISHDLSFHTPSLDQISLSNPATLTYQHCTLTLIDTGILDFDMLGSDWDDRYEEEESSMLDFSPLVFNFQGYNTGNNYLVPTASSHFKSKSSTIPILEHTPKPRIRYKTRLSRHWLTFQHLKKNSGFPLKRNVKMKFQLL
jgi:hypothetical protein